MKYFNILKQIEIEILRKRNKKVKKFSLKKFTSEYFLYIIASITFVAALVEKYWRDNSTWASYLLLFSIAMMHLSFIMFIFFKFIIKEFKWRNLSFNRQMNINVKIHYFVDKKYFKHLLQLDLSELKLGYLELNNEYLHMKKRTGLVIGPLHRLGIFPQIIAAGFMYYNIKGSLTNDIIQIFCFATIGVMLFTVPFYKMLNNYERMLELTKLAIELKENQTK